jgi:hypothetical protein
VPISLVVSDYRQGVNAGGQAYTDSNGDSWATDQAYSEGGWGYVEPSEIWQTDAAISGTDDDPLYQDARVNPYAYRFDGLPAGQYAVELLFADFLEGLGNEIYLPMVVAHQNSGWMMERLERASSKRVFDVLIEGDLVLPVHDIVFDVGYQAADDHTFFVYVGDGRLDIRLVPKTGFDPPIINALRVTQRPDR